MSRIAVLSLVLLVGCSDELVVRFEIEKAKAERQRASALVEAKLDVENEVARLMGEFRELWKTAPEDAERGEKLVQGLLAMPWKGTDLERYQSIRTEIMGKTAAQFINEQDARAASAGQRFDTVQTR